MISTNLRSKLETLRWYAARPALYRELVRKLVRRQFSTATSAQKRDQDKRDGQAWCRDHLASETELYANLGIAARATPVAETHAREWAAASSAVEACPVRMGGAADVTVLYHLVRYLPARRVLETGVASGWSSLAVLLAMREAGQGRLISIDMPYAKLNNENYVGCAVPDDLRKNWKLVRRSDRDGLEPALKELGGLDLAHYDSDKSYAGRTFAYPRLWAALRDGGVLMSDDVEDNLAFRDFALSVGRKAWIFEKKPGNYAGVLVK